MESITVKPGTYNLGKLINQLDEKHVYGIELIVGEDSIELKGKTNEQSGH